MFHKQISCEQTVIPSTKTAAKHFKDDYVWYKQGQNGHRHDNIPPFELDEGKVKLAVGELYCRHEIEPGKLCLRNTPFSSESKLRSHIKRHGVAVETPGKGRRKPADLVAAKAFYRNLRAHVQSGAAGGPAPAIATPSKLPNQRTPRHANRSGGTTETRLAPAERNDDEEDMDDAEDSAGNESGDDNADGENDEDGENNENGDDGDDLLSEWFRGN
ncbi:hypothetical protein C8A00DRAFT_31920 [Chaetomidium leptoderma]|uniref:Uncharacterized protein n=1 Tax=Chaetomidium leptoderma TaxID=669021 RepID=A0AAN6ZX72_9PEZI|nr:hypothetical protein C8A00DRAFT_31920 [Chaetomidium leptoderma]